MTNYDPMNVKITTNKDLTYVLSENERKMLLEDACVILPAGAGNKAGAWAVRKVNPKSVLIMSLLDSSNKPMEGIAPGEHRFVLNDDKLQIEGVLCSVWGRGSVSVVQYVTRSGPAPPPSSQVVREAPAGVPAPPSSSQLLPR